jgi:ATP-dependent Clp protease adaptor protein ClpS
MTENTTSPVCEQPQVSALPPWKVILHNDPVNTAEFVVVKVREITRLEEKKAMEKVMEAHAEGTSILLTTHKEKAELLVSMFKASNITVTMEKA